MCVALYVQRGTDGGGGAVAEDMCAFLHAVMMGTSNFALKAEGADARRSLDDAWIRRQKEDGEYGAGR